MLEKIIPLIIGLFLFFTIVLPSSRKGFLSKTRNDWVLDVCSLACHFFIIPFAQIAIAYQLYVWIFPGLQASFSVSILGSFLLYLALDYGWYWNHRLFHAQTPLWNFHMVHHAPEHLDVLVTPRNSIWSHFLMVYFWFIALVTFLLKDSTWFLTFVGMGVIVNFWGHTRFNFKKNSFAQRFLSLFLITPFEHFWHHSRENPYCNFGTVFNFWDRIHGTWYSPADLPQELGGELDLPLWRQLFFPFSSKIKN